MSAGTRAAAIPPAAPPGSRQQATTRTRPADVAPDRFVTTPPGTLIGVIRLIVRLGILALATFGAYVLYLRVAH